MVMIVSTQGLDGSARTLAEGDYIGLPGGSHQKLIELEDGTLVPVKPSKVVKKKMQRREVKKKK